MIKKRISNLIYKLDLPAKMKIYSVQHVAILKPAHRNVEPPIYKIETYKSQKKNEMFRKL